MIQVEHLSHFYHSNQVLKDINFSQERGTVTAIIGPSGSGKTTLLQHLNGLLLPDSGTVKIAGTPVSQNLSRARQIVGMVFQNPDSQIVGETVSEDVAFGPLHMGLPEAEVRERVSGALAQVGMTDYADRLSHHLSVGEKKRIAIATVLSMTPDILVLDEPSAGLDPRARRNLITLLDELPITMLVSSHDMLMVRELFPRMVIMNEGRIVADGWTEQLMDDVELLEAHGLERP